MSKGKVGMSCLIITECFFFVSFIVAYLYYIVILQVDDGGPNPEELFRSDWMVYIASICLLSSSVTVVFASRALAAGAQDKIPRSWLFLTILLGGLFIASTALEWTGPDRQQGHVAGHLHAGNLLLLIWSVFMPSMSASV